MAYVTGANGRDIKGGHKKRWTAKVIFPLWPGEGGMLQGLQRQQTMVAGAGQQQARAKMRLEGAGGQEV